MARSTTATSATAPRAPAIPTAPFLPAVRSLTLSFLAVQQRDGRPHRSMGPPVPTSCPSSLRPSGAAVLAGSCFPELPPGAWRPVGLGHDDRFARVAVFGEDHFGLDLEAALRALPLLRDGAVGDELLALFERRADLDLDELYGRVGSSGHGGHQRNFGDELRTEARAAVEVDVVARREDFQQRRRVAEREELEAARAEERVQFRRLFDSFFAEGDDA